LPGGCPRILFPKFTHLSYIVQNPLNPRLICFGAAGTVMLEELAIILFFLFLLAIIVMAVLYLERHW
jgi:hypothetical protein